MKAPDETPTEAAARSMRSLRIAGLLAVIGLALMMWSLIDPRAQPVLIALSVGQVIGTLSLFLYVRVIVQDYRAKKRGLPARMEGEESVSGGT